MNFTQRWVRHLIEHMIKTTTLVRQVKRTDDLLRQPESVVLFLHISIHRDVGQGSQVSKISIT